MWKIDATAEYLAWFEMQNGDAKVAILAKVLLLQEYGPDLRRPHADTLRGCRYKNLRELRAKTSSQVLRVLYYFDPARKAFLLTGGDKKGRNSKTFYKKLIGEAERLIERQEGT